MIAQRVLEICAVIGIIAMFFGSDTAHIFGIGLWIPYGIYLPLDVIKRLSQGGKS